MTLIFLTDRLLFSENGTISAFNQEQYAASFSFSIFIRDKLTVLLYRHLFPSSACIGDWRGSLFKSSRKHSRRGLSGRHKIGQALKQVFSVPVITEDFPLINSPNNHMAHYTRCIQSCLPGHDSQTSTSVKIPQLKN